MKKWIVITLLVAMAAWAIITNTATKEEAKETKTQPDVAIGTNIGEAAPNFMVQSLDGKDVNLSDYRGKRVLLNFWATWCPPCRVEMPEMQRFYEDMKAEGVEVVAVNATSLEKSVENVKLFMEENGYTFPVLLDEDGKVSPLYKVSSIPTTYVLDQDGIIQDKHVGPMSYDDMKEYVNKLEQ